MAKISAIHIPADLRNHAINGAMDFWQSVAGSTTTVNTSTVTVSRTADMFVSESGGGTTKNYSIVRSTDIPTVAQSGFQGTYSYLFTMITGIASPAAGDLVLPFEYKMEGFDYEKLHAKIVTIGFWIKASVAGTYTLALLNGTGPRRSYVTNFTVSGSATWEFKSITVTLDSSGTWLFDNSVGLLVFIGSYCGSTFTTGLTDTWQTGEFYTLTGATNWQATSAATLQVTQLSIVEGPLGLGAKGFARRGDSIQSELAMCQRYYCKTYPVDSQPGTVEAGNVGLRYRAKAVASGEVVLPWSFPVTMRALPSCQVYSLTGTAGRIRDATAAADIVSSVQQFGTQSVVAWNDNAVVNGNQYTCHYTADARL